MNENSVFSDRDDHIILDKLANEVAGSRFGNEVLVIDLDPQGYLTSGAGFDELYTE